jgi:hypothetical protein
VPSFAWGASVHYGCGNFTMNSAKFAGAEASSMRMRAPKYAVVGEYV